MQWWLTIASIRLAVVFLCAWFILGGQHRQDSGQGSQRRRWVDLIWLGGSLFSLVHMIAVFAYIHDWSHQLAVEDTARQTEDFMGTSVGFGVYFNYLFVVVWLVDAAWLWLANESYQQRSVWINRLVFGFLLFIAFNGAVVFVSGWFRWFAAMLFFLLAIRWMTGWQRYSRIQTELKSDSTV